MSRIVKSVNEEVLRRTAKRCRERGVTVPTFAQMRDPGTVPDAVKSRLRQVGLWDLDPANLFRITWRNDVGSGLFGGVNALEIPSALTGVKARIIGLVGKFFPTGAHKVGAAFGCLVPRLVSGGFDPERHRAVWPSTGNYCRGGAFDSAILGCTAVAILPEGMSKERFQWLKEIGAEVIATHGCESNVKEIYDKCWELKRDPMNVIFNQFEEFGNPIWHYNVTGPALQEAFVASSGGRLSAYVSATGSAGTIGAGDFLKTLHPGVRIVATEAQQCPTLFMNGFGDHRIEGIGDKHVPWVHNVRATDAVAAIDDEDCMRLLRLFNEPAGEAHLAAQGVDAATLANLKLLGISGICNLLAAIKAAKHWELGEQDVILTIFTDSVEMYRSRLDELREERGAYAAVHAGMDQDACLLHQGPDWFKELGFNDRKALHNLKYYTWVEQQGRTVEELNQLWDPEFWRDTFQTEGQAFDRLIGDFNTEVARA